MAVDSTLRARIPKENIGRMLRVHGSLLGVALGIGGWLQCGCVAADAIAGLGADAYAVRSIDIEESDFSDLEAFGRFVGDARVVALGEHHEDGRSLVAMARLVRFLHEKKGFDVLAFESGLVDMEAVDQAIASGRAIAESVELGVASPWSQSLQVRPLFEYVAKTKHSRRPMSLAGFDVERTALREAKANEQWERALFEAFDDLRIGADRETRECLSRSIRSKAHTRELCALAFVERLEPELRWSRFGTEVARGRAVQVLRSIAAERRSEAERAGAPDYREDVEAYSRFMEEVGPRCSRLRDAGMGENLLWLIQSRFSGRKVIVWGAEGHTRRGSMGAGVPSAMSHVVGVLGAAVRSVTFVWYSGELGIYGRSEPVASEPDSLEAKLHGLKRPFAFVDIRGPKVQPAPELKPWYGNHDGLFFIDEMTPNTLAPDGTWAQDAKVRGGGK